MKNKRAKFGIFTTTDSGADYLVTARKKDGTPLMSYADAQERLNDFPEEKPKMIIRGV